MSELKEDILYKKETIIKNFPSNGVVARLIYDEFKESGKEEIVLVNIGTDKVMFDCFAPLLGTLLEGKVDFPVYGTLENPIHGLNLDREYSKVLEKHPNAFIIGSDACIGSDGEVFDIIARTKPISPAKGLGKEMTKVGDVSLVCITSTSTNLDILFHQNTRLSDVYNMSKKASEELIKLNDMINSNL